MDTRKRDIETTDLPTLVNDIPPTDQSQFEVLKILYGETNTNYRNLADIRFKLLGLLPAVSIIAWAELYQKISTDNFTSALFGLAVTILGLRITYGVWVYENRNDELYNDLVSRGRKIEEEFGVHTALFKGRLQPNKKDRFGKIINHGRSLHIIYGSVFIGWTLLLLWYVFHLLQLIDLF